MLNVSAKKNSYARTTRTFKKLAKQQQIVHSTTNTAANAKFASVSFVAVRRRAQVAFIANFKADEDDDAHPLEERSQLLHFR